MIEFALLIKFAIHFPFGMEGGREGGIVPKYTASNEGTRFLVTTQSTLFFIPFVVFLGVAVFDSYGSHERSGQLPCKQSTYHQMHLSGGQWHHI